MPAKLSLPLPVDLYDLTNADKVNIKRENSFGILAPTDKRLNLVSEPVTDELFCTDKLNKLIEKMILAASGQRKGRTNKKTRLLVGIAAPQVGIMKRIILVDTKIKADKKKMGKLMYFVNPKIIWRSRETEEGLEGCFSAGPVRGIVRRPIAVKVSAFNVSGEPFERIFEGYTARIIQHEIDHLNGIRFPERIRIDRNLHWVHDEEIVVYPKLARNWLRKCDKKRWKKLITG